MQDFIGVALSTVAVLAVVLAPIALKRKIQANRAREWEVEQTAPFGEELATAVAGFLQRGLVVAYRHRDGCGMGLRYAEGAFIYGSVSDGELPTPSEAVAWQWADKERKEFADTDSFVRWLSVQTGNSLGVQTPYSQHLTRHRLMKAVEFCSKNEPSRWPPYAG
ncbi:hypothetical protein OIN59_08775 [Acidovorax sp. D2M1]|uniref:Uncharacterized protein n=1 Tax=Acidovorax benzenivorans TaxID=2987520 RepID=A0ABT5RV00_9BURK|nr:hypothetical protein [Acidovorax benzenivorans]MDD2177528.1 hypothetical protein [Acidovorax benzenivorans]